MSGRANGEGSIYPYRWGWAAYVWVTTPAGVKDRQGYPKLSLKKYKPIAARNEDAKVSRGLL